MDRVIYWATLGLVKMLQALPLRWVARIGRAGGALFYMLDSRHRKVAIRNLTLCFGAEKAPAEIRALARQNFRRIGENYCCAVKTAAMPLSQLQPHLDISCAEKFLSVNSSEPIGNRVVAIGHFGNFELYARYAQAQSLFRTATTYRGLRQPSLDRLMKRLRAASGCLFFERRTEAGALKAAMNRSGFILGLLADQHAGRSGVRLPFLGHECSTTTAPALFALRYNAPLHVSICYRVGLARWRIELSDPIPTRENGRRRSVADITLDVNHAFEAAIRRDPANWFWVHNRWKVKESSRSV